MHENLSSSLSDRKLKEIVLQRDGNEIDYVKISRINSIFTATRFLAL